MDRTNLRRGSKDAQTAGAQRVCGQWRPSHVLFIAGFGMGQNHPK